MKTEPQLSELMNACKRLRLALTQVQLAVADLHEAFIAMHPEEGRQIERHAAEAIRKAARR